MDHLLSLVGGTGRDSRVGGSDSYCDRLSCTYTVYLLMLLSVLVTGKLFVGEPIACWCPDHFFDSQVKYTNNVCWTTNTYNLPFSHEIPKEGERRNYISYYQWIPLILITQAVMFYLPRPVWNLLNKKSGIALCTITDAAIECQKQNSTDEKDKIMCYITKHLGSYLLALHKQSQMVNCCTSLKAALCGRYLYLMYLLSKCLYIANVIGQLFLLNRFLGGGYEWFGFEVLMRLTRGEEWGGSDRFPRVTLCDFKIRVLGNVHRYTVLCSLPMNLLNEIVFIFLWFWFVVVACATVASLLMWAVCVARDQRYILTILALMDDNQAASSTNKKLFLTKFLRRDGVFMLKMVAKNTSKILTADLIVELWKYFLEHRSSFLPEEGPGSEAELNLSDHGPD